MCFVKILEQIPLFVHIDINDSHAFISTKLMKYAVLYTAAMIGGKQLLRKS